MTACDFTHHEGLCGDCNEPLETCHGPALRAAAQTANAEVDKIATVCALISAALLGHLQPHHPYEGKPLPPVEEALRARRTVARLAERALRAQSRGLCDVTDADIAELVAQEDKATAKEMPIPYRQTPEKESPL